MFISRGRSLKVISVMIVAAALAYAYWPKVKEVFQYSGIPLPEGCAVIQRMPQAIFIRCVVKGNWVYLATLTSRGVTMGQPVRF